MKEARRRLFISGLAIALSACFLRPQISSSLVLRGDDLHARGQATRALLMYRRAVAWDNGNETAADRLAFDLATSHRRKLVEDAIEVASRYLQRQPNSITLLMDRGLAKQILHRYRSAESDYGRAARLDPNPRTLTFAGFAALHAGDRVAARLLFTEAEQREKGFVPALHGLAQL